MAAYTWADGANKEDLLDILTNLSPTETQLISGLGTSKANGTLHQWLTDTLSAVKANAFAEGADASYTALTNPTRLTNVTQISRQAFQVSGTERAVDTAGFSDRMAYEAEKAMKVIKNDMELAIMCGTLTQSVVSTNTARSLTGVKAALVSMTSSQSGVSLTETIFNNYLQLVWDTTNVEVDEVYGDMTMKRRISGFTGNATKNVNVTDKRLVNSVSVYEADAARLVKIFAHRYVNLLASGSAVTNHDLVGINSEKFKVAYLRKPFMTDLAKTGDSDKAEIITEYTLEYLNPYAGFVAKSLL